MYIYISPLPLEPPSPPPSHPCRPSQSPELSSLCYSAASHELCFIHGSVCMSALCSQFSSPPPSPHTLCAHVSSLCLGLYSCPENRLLCTTPPVFLWAFFFLPLDNILCGRFYLQGIYTRMWPYLLSNSIPGSSGRWKQGADMRAGWGLWGSEFFLVMITPHLSSAQGQCPGTGVRQD